MNDESKKDDDGPDVWQHPHSGEVLISPKIQAQIKHEMDTVRDAVLDKIMNLIEELSPEHRPDAICAALMEAGIQQAVSKWGEEVVTPKFVELMKERGDPLDAIANTPSGIVLDRIVEAKLKESAT